MASNEWILVKSELRDTSLYPEVEFGEILDGYEPKPTQKPAICDMDMINQFDRTLTLKDMPPVQAEGRSLEERLKDLTLCKASDCPMPATWKGEGFCYEHYRKQTKPKEVGAYQRTHMPRRPNTLPIEPIELGMASETRDRKEAIKRENSAHPKAPGLMRRRRHIRQNTRNKKTQTRRVCPYNAPKPTLKPPQSPKQLLNDKEIEDEYGHLVEAIIEVSKTATRKCKNTACYNMGNPKKSDHCNECHARMESQDREAPIPL